MRKKADPAADGEKDATNIKYVLCLFITGISPNSVRAISNIKEFCEKHLKGHYSLEVVDVYQQGDKAVKEQIIALPVLVKKFPLPERRLIGDMSDTDKVLKGLGLQPE